MSTLTLKFVLLFLPAIFLMNGAATKQKSDVPPDQVNRVFDEIEAAILAGDVKKLSPYFGRQMNLNLHAGMSGYFSSNQSYYILQNYFSSKKILSFRFTSRKPDDASPFATGGGTARTKGINEILQFYVSLVEVDSRWVISQFNVY
jgi:hypothetical protein